MLLQQNAKRRGTTLNGPMYVLKFEQTESGY
jgi:hypothetical protein